MPPCLHHCLHTIYSESLKAGIGMTSSLDCFILYNSIVITFRYVNRKNCSYGETFCRCYHRLTLSVLTPSVCAKSSIAIIFCKHSEFGIKTVFAAVVFLASGYRLSLLHISCVIQSYWYTHLLTYTTEL